MQGSSSSSGSDASLILKRCIVLDAIVRAVGREISRRRFPGVSPCAGSVFCVRTSIIFTSLCMHTSLPPTNQCPSLFVLDLYYELLLYSRATVYFWCGAAGIRRDNAHQAGLRSAGLGRPGARMCVVVQRVDLPRHAGGHIDQHNAVARVRSYTTIVSRSRELRSDERAPAQPVVTGRKASVNCD